MNIKAVIFDLDGTLMDTMPDFFRAVNHSLERCGFPQRKLEEFNRIIGGGIRQALGLALPEGCGETDVDNMLAAYLPFYGENCWQNTYPYEGMEQLVEQLEKKGVALGVLTNKSENLAQLIVRERMPRVPFRFVWGSVENRPLKPLPDVGFMLLELLGLRAEEVAYVGDSDTDIQFALGCGMYPVGAVWGYRGREELAQAGAKLLAETPLDILQLFA